MRRSLTRQAVLSYLVMGFLALFFLFPVAIMVVGSFKPDTTVITDQTSMRAFDPRPFEGLDNYESAADTGNYFTSLEMMGATVTVMRLDVELRSCLDLEADSVGLRQLPL